MNDTFLQSVESAKNEFNELIKKYREQALWFTKPDITIDIRNPEASRVLEQLAAHSSRSVWIVIRKLKKWHLQNRK